MCGIYQVLTHVDSSMNNVRCDLVFFNLFIWSNHYSRHCIVWYLEIFRKKYVKINKKQKEWYHSFQYVIKFASRITIVTPWAMIVIHFSVPVTVFPTKFSCIFQQTMMMMSMTWYSWPFAIKSPNGMFKPCWTIYNKYKYAFLYANNTCRRVVDCRYQDWLGCLHVAGAPTLLPSYIAHVYICCPKWWHECTQH